MSAQSRILQVTAPGGALAMTEIPIPEPQPGWVRICVEASGICRADLGRLASTETPITPGHEIAGRIDALGNGVTGWPLGERVAVGWFGGSCGTCRFCRRGDVVHCPERKIPGVSYPGGFAEHVLVPADALVRMPAGLSAANAAPLGCAGVTSFTAIRRAQLPAGSTVAVFGIGGLGHLAIQFAAKLGHRVIALARGDERAELALQLGAHEYIDTSANSAGSALAQLGSADLILSTASSTAPVADLLGGLAVGGRLTMIGVDAGTVEVPATQLIMNSQILTGHLTGSTVDIEDTLHFAALHGITPMLERTRLEQVPGQLDRLAAGQVRFRLLIEP